MSRRMMLVRLAIALALVFTFVPSVVHARMVLTGPLTFYIDPINGNDANPGTQAAPFATFQHCGDNATQTLDASGFTITCQSVPANAVYSGAAYSTFQSVVGQGSAETLVFDGNGSQFVMNAPVGNPLAIWSTGNFGAPPSIAECAATPRFSLRRMTLTGSNADLIQVNGGTINILDGVTFGPDPGGRHILVECGGAVFAAMHGSYTISGGAAIHLASWVFGDGVIQSETVNIVPCTANSTGCSSGGHPVFSVSFLDAQWGGIIFVPFNGFSGIAEGPRYYLSAGGNIDTEISNPTYVPGSLPGVCVPPAIYAGAPCGQQNGSGSFPSGLSSSIGPVFYNAAAITFPTPYASPPQVSCQASAVICSVVGSKASGFTLYVWSYNPYSLGISYTWLASSY